MSSRSAKGDLSEEGGDDLLWTVSVRDRHSCERRKALGEERERERERGGMHILIAYPLLIPLQMIYFPPVPATTNRRTHVFPLFRRLRDDG